MIDIVISTISCTLYYYEMKLKKSRLIGLC